MDLMFVTMLLIAVFSVLHGLITWAVIRRLRLLESATMRTPEDVLPPVGTSSGPFAIRTLSGRDITDRDLREGELLLILLSPECRPCRDLVSRVAASGDTDDPGTLAVVYGDGTQEACQRMVASLPPSMPVAVDEFGAVAAAFGVTAYPSVVLVRDGAVVAAAHEFEPVHAKRLSALTSA